MTKSDILTISNSEPSNSSDGFPNAFNRSPSLWYPMASLKATLAGGQSIITDAMMCRQKNPANCLLCPVSWNASR